MKYKILRKALGFRIMIAMTLAPGLRATGQNGPKRPEVVDQVRAFSALVAADERKRCLPLSGIPNLYLDLRYAGANNFTGRPVYEDRPQETYLRRAPAMALDSVARDLGLKGLGLVIFDAYRPYRATVALWNLVRDDRYAADPAKGSGHNRAIAVDLSLYEVATKRQLTMPTGFDNFSDTAHQDFTELSDSVITNRQLLRVTMEKYGFVALPTEWWHFSWPHPERYELLDLSFAQMGRLAGRPFTPRRASVRGESAVPARGNRPAPGR